MLKLNNRLAQTVFTKECNSFVGLDTSELNSGVYILKILGEGRVIQ